MTKDLMDSTELNTMDERSRDEYFMSLAIEEGKKRMPWRNSYWRHFGPR